MKLYYIKWLLTLFLYSGLIYSIGSIKAGEEKAIICMACHGKDGLSINEAWPNLAGQHAKYLKKELKDFKLGKTRNEPTMSSMVANLTPEDIEDLATFYATKTISQNKKVVDNIARGENIYKRGDLKKHITACIACHGPDGKGNDQAGFPVLAGQNIQYIIKQLQAFKDKSRTNDISAIMYDISNHMNEDDMREVAKYIYQLK